MEHNIYLLIILIFINFIFLYFQNFFSRILNIYDVPDNKRKFHKSPVPLIGGPIIGLNFILIIFLSQFLFLKIEIFICCLFFFIVGFMDDKVKLNPFDKLFLNIIILLFFFGFNENLLISKVNLFNINFEFNFLFSLLFSILCILLFVNSLNLFDGINLQTLAYCLIILIFLSIKDHFSPHLYFIIIPILFLIYPNYRSKLFLGDSGVYLLGSFIALTVIDFHNYGMKINTEEILILMMIPGFDMFRLFVQRIYNKKNPFDGDRNHLHHLLLIKYGYNKTIFFIMILIILPIISITLIDSRIIITLYTLLYLLLIFRLKSIEF